MWWGGRRKEGETVARQIEKRHNLAAFWALGLLNNIVYVIMLAGAKEISAGGVGLVFLADIAPTFLVKLTAPYWFHYFAYSIRASICGVLMAASLITVATGETLAVQLIGVGFCSLHAGIGEASMLGLTAQYHGPSTITAWSSGTGFAGILGYGWVVFFHLLCGVSFSSTLLVALVLPLGWIATFFFGLGDPSSETYRGVMEDINNELSSAADDLNGTASSALIRPGTASAVYALHPPSMEEVEEEEEEWEEELPCRRRTEGGGRGAGRTGWERRRKGHPQTHAFTMRERWQLFLSLWPYTVPLITVYWAEYAMQSGTWSAIGFPVYSEKARKSFYFYANMCYQVGVFISRSSGMFISPSLTLLWILPALQCLLLIFFSLNAVWQFWYDWTLLIPCFIAGLLGGAVYVAGFSLISRNSREEHRELALVSSSIADTVGIMLSDVFGLVLQGCLYRANGIPGATFSCGA
ncbi:protein btn1 [Nannochloropsis oceanica]